MCNRRRRDDENGGHDGDDDDDEDGPGPDDLGPRSKWSVGRLSHIDRQTLDTYPPPRSDGSGNDEAIEGDIQFDAAVAKFVEMSLWSEGDDNGDDGVD